MVGLILKLNFSFEDVCRVFSEVSSLFGEEDVAHLVEKLSVKALEGEPINQTHLRRRVKSQSLSTLPAFFAAHTNTGTIFI
jgi:hypothetical protein